MAISEKKVSILPPKGLLRTVPSYEGQKRLETLSRRN